MTTRHDELRAQCNAFHTRHPEVWDLFEKFALERAALGFHHYGAKAVMERVRWECDFARGPDETLKINNDYPAFYARRFLRLHPELPDFFRLREQTSAGKPAREAA